MKSTLGLIFCFLWIFVFADNNQNSSGSDEFNSDILKSSGPAITPFPANATRAIFTEYTISGTVRYASTLQPFAGVTITFSNGYGSVVTNSLGQYSMVVTSGYIGTVTPYFCGYYSFSPAQRSYTNVQQNFSNQDFLASPSQNFTINGTFINQSTGLPLANYTVNFGNGLTTITNSQGQYSLQVTPCASYTLTPTAEQYNFIPVSRSYTNVTSNFYDQDFEAAIKLIGLPPGWEFVNTANVHFIVIKTTANPNFCGTSLQNGDWIGVFYVGDDGLLHCGGAGMWTGTENTVVVAQGDDTQTTPGVKDGFSVFETMNWKVYTATQTQQEYLAYPVYETGAGYSSNNKWAPLGASIISSLPAFKTHNVVIPQGWSGISSYFLPRTTAVTTLMAPILSKLVILQNLTNTYWPSQSINTIVNWSSVSGYKIKVTEPVTLPIIGCDYSPKTLSLVAGWNLIPVLSDCNAQIETLFASNMSKITVIKEVAGTNIYWPAMNIKTLLTFQPGKAYMISVNSDFSVTFPACASFKEEEINEKVFKNNSPWNNPVATPSNHSIAMPVGISDKLLMGDIIGAFTPDGICAGMVQIDNISENILLQVFGDDPSTDEKDGFMDGEILHFKLYRPNLNQEFEISVNFDASLPSSNGLFTTDGLSAATKLVFNPTFIGEPGNPIISFYPNPGNGLINFIAGDSQQIFTVTIFGLTGQKTYETTFSGMTQIDLFNAPKGIYVVKIESTNFIKTEKLVIQ